MHAHNNARLALDDVPKEVSMLLESCKQAFSTELLGYGGTVATRIVTMYHIYSVHMSSEEVLKNLKHESYAWMIRAAEHGKNLREASCGFCHTTNKTNGNGNGQHFMRTCSYLLETLLSYVVSPTQQNSSNSRIKSSWDTIVRVGGAVMVMIENFSIGALLFVAPTVYVFFM